MVSQRTKFEVSRFTRYEAMNDSAKCRILGGLGRLGCTQSHRQCHHSIERIDFLFDFNRNHASILYRFRDIAGYLSKVADFYRGDLWRQKTRVPGLSCGVVYAILRLAVSVELRLVTDRQTDTGPWLV